MTKGPTTMDAMLHDLQGLARETSAEGRAQLINKLTDLFFRGAQRHDERVVELFEDVICRVLEDVDVQVRADLSDRLAMAPKAPRRVVRQLAEDEIPVAEPILRHSTVLDEATLTRLAERLGDGHLAAIAHRVYLHETVTDVVIRRGDSSVRRLIAGNDGAQITTEGYDQLMSGAQADQILQEMLVRRENMPEAVRGRLMPLLAAEVRRRVLDRLDQQAAGAIEDALDGEYDAIVQRLDKASRDRLAYADLQRAFDDGTISLDEALCESCRQDRHDWVVDLLTFAGPLDRGRVLQALLEKDPKPIAVLLRALDVAPATFGAILELRTKRLRVGSNAPKLVDDYGFMDKATALTVLRHLRLKLKQVG